MLDFYLFPLIIYRHIDIDVITFKINHMVVDGEFYISHEMMKHVGIHAVPWIGKMMRLTHMIFL